VVALGTGALVTGCDSDATIAKSGVGESCDSSADCDDGLNCLQGACYKTAPDTGGGEGGGDDPGVGPTPPVLGGEGESCTKAADCGEGLGCFNQRCITAPTGDGGEGNVPGGPVLGKNGETCETTTDCEDGLSCVPGGYPGLPPGTATGFVGVCSKTSGTLTPTGKNCQAECVEATDCCELPLQLHVPWAALDTPGTSGPYGTGAQSCSEVAALIKLNGSCATAGNGTLLAALCFAQTAYCECEDTWTCDAGACNYAAECSVAGSNVEGCPTFTRSGRPTGFTTCTKNECGAAAVTGCKKDADCDDGTTFDTLENCTEGECTCYKAMGVCYRRCDTNLDCPVSPVKSPGTDTICDTDTNVCVPSDQCNTNEECAIKMGSTKYTCVDKTCMLTCDTDYDCNAGAISSIESTVCVEHLCTPIGCSDDVQCTSGAGHTGVRMFCTTPEPVEPGAMVFSAITD
jgi:hypothetical protein